MGDIDSFIAGHVLVFGPGARTPSIRSIHPHWMEHFSGTSEALNWVVNGVPGGVSFTPASSLVNPFRMPTGYGNVLIAMSMPHDGDHTSDAPSYPRVPSSIESASATRSHRDIVSSYFKGLLQEKVFDSVNHAWEHDIELEGIVDGDAGDPLGPAGTGYVSGGLNDEAVYFCGGDTISVEDPDDPGVYQEVPFDSWSNFRLQRLVSREGPLVSYRTGNRDGSPGETFYLLTDAGGAQPLLSVLANPLGQAQDLISFEVAVSPPVWGVDDRTIVYVWDRPSDGRFTDEYLEETQPSVRINVGGTVYDQWMNDNGHWYIEDVEDRTGLVKFRADVYVIPPGSDTYGIVTGHSEVAVSFRPTRFGLPPRGSGPDGGDGSSTTTISVSYTANASDPSVTPTAYVDSCLFPSYHDGIEGGSGTFQTTLRRSHHWQLITSA